MREDIKSMTLEELTQAVRDMGEPAFRGRQIFTWLHQRGAASFEEMTDLSKALREKLDLLEVLNEELAACGEEVQARRRAYLDLLAPMAAENYRELSRGEWPVPSAC